MKICLLIEYLGTHFSGWQKQPHRPSIQETIEQALFQITRSLIPIVGSGRTDAGVHAKGQVAHFTPTDHPIFQRPRQLMHSLNSILPPDIKIKNLSQAPDHFHAQRSAIAKEYQYLLSWDCKPNPMLAPFCFAPKIQLHLDRMQSAAHYLIGTHDFASFANTNRSYTSTVRTLYQITFTPHESHLTIAFKGSGFLYKMVRTLVGGLLEVSKHSYEPDHLLTILKQKDRRAGPPAVPPHGLMLNTVWYPQEFLLFPKERISSNDW